MVSALTKLKWRNTDAYLQEIGKDKKWLSISSGLSKNALFSWKDGKDVRIDSLVKVASFLNVTVEDLVLEGHDAVKAYLEMGKRKNSTLEVAPLWRVIASRGGSSVSAAGNALSATYNKEIRDFVRTLNLESLLDDQALTNHRFRKTIARLVALCYTHAPQILMDIFGHKDIDMTLHYILQDETLITEIEKIRREIMVIKGIDAVQNASLNGGPAAKRIVSAIDNLKIAKNDFGTDDAEELAIMLTVDGRYWQYVRPGIICTKLPDEPAPCAKGKSVSNKSSCQSNCAHRLEEAAYQRDVNEALEELVLFFEKALKDGDQIMAEMWKGQILSNIRRFDTLYEKWCTHKAVAEILSDAKHNDKDRIMEGKF